MRRRRSAENDREEEQDYVSPTRRRRRRWPLYLIALLVFTFFAPNLIGWSGIHRWVVPWVAADFQGRIEVERISLGWLEPAAIQGIRVLDAEGKTLAEVDSITASRSLLSWLSGGELGVFRVVRPNVLVAPRPDGSNWEDALAVYLEQWLAPGDPQPIPALTVEWVEGQITLVEPNGQTMWQARQLEGTVITTAPRQPFTLRCAAVIQQTVFNERGEPQLQPAGGLALEGVIDEGTDELTWSDANLHLQAEKLPLGWASPLLTRFLAATEVEGTVQGELRSRLNLATMAAQVELNQFRGQQLRVRCPSLLGQDVVRLEHWQGQGHFRLTETELAASQFRAEADLGSIRADGNFRFEELSQLVQQGRLPATPLQVDGKLDLAQLARVLPQTLQLHKDLELQSGELSFQINQRVEQEVPRLVFNLDTVNLNATRAGQAIIWAKPIRLVGTVTESAEWLAVENFRCESEFLEIEGNGNLRSAAFRVSGDLARLTERLGQFAELQGTRLEGAFEGKFGWQVAESVPADRALGEGPLPLQLGGSFRIEQPLIAWPQLAPWQDKELELMFSAAGQAVPGAAPSSSFRWQMEQGGLQLEAGSESAVIKLAQPVEDLFGDQPLRADCRLTGQLANWLAHLRRWVDPGVEATGTMDVTTQLVWTPQSMEFGGTHYEVQQLTWDGWGMRLTEPQVHGDLTANYDLPQGNFRISDITLVASSVAARGRDIEIAYAGDWQLRGEVAYRANVNRVADWFELSPSDDSVFWFGTAEGTVRWLPHNRSIAMQLDTTVKELVAAKLIPAQPNAPTNSIIQVGGAQRQWDALWQDPAVKLKGKLVLDADLNGLQLVDTEVIAESLQASVSGTVDDLWQTMTTDVQGTWQPDWSQINRLLAAYTGNIFHFEGRQPQTFQIRGPLFAAQPSASAPWVPRQLTAAATLGWESGSLLDLPVGPAQWQINLNQGVAAAKSEGIPFAGGKLQLQPTVDLTTADPVLHSGWTRIVDDVELQAETARKWLRYVAPLAAEATSAQGHFTVDLGEAHVPLLRPSQLQARGAIKMRDVVIGAGPLAQQLLATVSQVRQLIKPESRQRDLGTWLKIPQQTIPIVIRDGRVFHDQVKFEQGDVAFQTRGSIGLDQTLDLVVELAIADDWIAGKPYLASLRGQTLKLPIKGTVSQPRLDTSAAQRLSAQLFQTAAQGAVQGAVEEKLQPRINQLQDKLNSEIQDQFNKLQNGLQDKLGIGNRPPATGEPVPPTGQPAPTLNPIPVPTANTPANELFQGLGNLLRRKDPPQRP